MAFLYADPIIRIDPQNTNRMIETQTPLDLIQEYQQIKENLLECNKKFSLNKIAVNSRSFVNAINENPKIIHLSCHGDY